MSNSILLLSLLKQFFKERYFVGGPADLKVFVDLAILSAGDEPMERNKVHCFHTAGLGFAPLIFIPKAISFTQLMRRIKDLEEKITDDVSLNDKLVPRFIIHKRNLLQSM